MRKYGRLSPSKDIVHPKHPAKESFWAQTATVLRARPYNWFQPIVSLNELKAPRLLSRHARIWSTVSIFILEIETFTLCLLWPYLNWERGVNSNLCLITLGSFTLYAIPYRVKQGACREPLVFKTGSLKFEQNPCNESRFFLWLKQVFPERMWAQGLPVFITGLQSVWPSVWY